MREPMRRIPASLIVALLLLLIPAWPAAAKEAIGVRAGLHEDYVRLVFDWPKSVEYSARIEVGRLVLIFPPGHSYDFSKAAGRLRKYLRLPNGEVSERRLAFPLLGDFELRHFTSGPKVVVDLIKRKAPPAEPKPAPAKPKAEKAQSKPAQSKPAQSKKAPAAKPEPPRAAAAKPEAKGAAPADAPWLGVRVGRHPGYGRLVFDWPKPVSYEVSAEAGRAVIRFGRSARIDIAALKKRLPPQVSDVEVEFSLNGLALTLAIHPEARVKHFTSGPKVALDILHDGKAPKTQASAPDKPPAKPTPLVKQPKAAEQPEPAPKAQYGALGEVVSRTPPEAEVRPVPGPLMPAAAEVRLRLPWTGAARAAAFRRGKNIWLAFSEPAPPILQERLAPEFGPLQRIDQAGGTLLYFEAPSGYQPSLRRVEGVWEVELSRQAVEPLSVLRAKLSDDLKSLLFRLADSGAILRATDAELGDQLIVVPVAAPGLGAGIERSFPEFRILKSFQGLVVQSLSDDVKLTRGPRELLLTARGPLGQSAGSVDLTADAGAGVREPLLDLATWRGPEGSDFLERKQALQRAVSESAQSRAPVARLALARFLFARGFSSEAMSLLDLVVKQRRDLAADPQITLMRAAGRALRGDFETAAAELEHAGLAEEWEAALWRAALAAKAQEWEVAAAGFAGADELIARYPKAIRAWLRLLATEAALETQDSASVTELLAALTNDKPSNIEQQRIQFLKGLQAKLQDNALRARRIWERVAEGQDAPSRARARLALIDLSLAEESMEPGEAIAELERLRFAWRGDFFEFALLERLAGLYQAEGDYRASLNTLRQAASHLPNFRRSEALGRRMRDIFTSLYLGEEADRVPPLRALSLYEEFKELTPVGTRGDEMIAHLADRLVEVDLLDEAGGLLEEQVKARLKGLEKARVGARLALIRLLDRDPAKALAALEGSRAKGLPASLAQERRNLRAKALAGVDRADEALALLKDDGSEAALRLRAEILTRLGRWTGVAEALGRLLPESFAEGQAAEAAQRGTVLSIAVAQTLAGDRNGLRRLKQRYGKAMAGTSEGETFTLLTEEKTVEGQAPITEVLARADHAEAFLTAYRKRLADGQLSQLN